MITTRRASPDDLPFINQHAYRLLEFGPPHWREQGAMTLADQEHLRNALLAADPDVALFIAEDEHNRPCGFIHLTMHTDYYTGERHAHLTDIVVIATAEGKGVGRLLLQLSEDWAREKKSRWITLNAFEANTHARAIYEKAGYQPEWTKYLKVLD